MCVRWAEGRSLSCRAQPSFRGLGRTETLELGEEAASPQVGRHRVSLLSHAEDSNFGYQLKGTGGESPEQPQESRPGEEHGQPFLGLRTTAPSLVEPYCFKLFHF